MSLVSFHVQRRRILPNETIAAIFNVFKFFYQIVFIVFMLSRCYILRVHVFFGDMCECFYISPCFMRFCIVIGHWYSLILCARNYSQISANIIATKSTLSSHRRCSVLEIAEADLQGGPKISSCRIIIEITLKPANKSICLREDVYRRSTRSLY